MDKTSKKISIIMPTYNDSESIIETFNSVISQTYDNYELVIVDDGSNDETKNIVSKYIEDNKLDGKFKYVYQDNEDQLRAIINGLNYITGDYIFVLHSDDLLASEDMLDKSITYMEENPNLDAIIGQLLVIDENSNLTGNIKINKYINKECTIANQLLWLGRNLYSDVGFYRKEVYIEKIKENYLRWNTPFWLCTTNECKMLNVETVSFNFIKYRIHSGNYINNEVGKLNVINGEIRTVSRIMKYYSIPCYRFQYIMFRLFTKLKLTKIYKIFYKKKETKNKSNIIKFVLNKRFNNEYKNNIFLNSLYNFYKKDTKRSVNFKEIYNGEMIYEGNQMRRFNNELIKNELPSLYINIMNEMEKGFNEIIVDNDLDYDKALNLTKFMCIYPYVNIVKK